jgi:glyoxylase-like metal-dependent hydrolase (beta-lactamase superfamily II)
MRIHDYGDRGHAEPRGAAIRRTIHDGETTVTITKLSVGPIDNNCYVLADTAAGAGLIIDAASDAPRILQVAGDLRIAAILTTHGHHDHWQALDDVARATDAPIVYHGADRARIPVAPDRLVEDTPSLTFGAATVGLRHTPGHTDGSVCAILTGIAQDRPAIRAHVFTGDTLFPGGPGKTQNAERFRQIMRSLRGCLFVMPDDTWVYPGHGDDTTLGDERGQLDEWQARGW